MGVREGVDYRNIVLTRLNIARPQINGYKYSIFFALYYSVSHISTNHFFENLMWVRDNPGPFISLLFRHSRQIGRISAVNRMEISEEDDRRMGTRTILKCNTKKKSPKASFRTNFYKGKLNLIHL
jgi:hypothetical protein